MTLYRPAKQARARIDVPPLPRDPTPFDFSISGNIEKQFFNIPKFMGIMETSISNIS